MRFHLRARPFTGFIYLRIFELFSAVLPSVLVPSNYVRLQKIARKNLWLFHAVPVGVHLQ